MLNSTIQKFQYGKHNITIETGTIGRQATSSLMIHMDDTSVLIAVVSDKKEKPSGSGQNFFPLKINYQERSYAAGRFPGGFFRREGRPNENEILVSRLIDRPVRPLFPKNFFHDVQITATVVSVDPEINPDIVSVIGVSAALSISGLPFKAPIGAARVGYINGQYILNPSTTELISSKLNMIVSGTSKGILMVESESKILTENQILEAMLYGHQKQQIIIENINELVKKIEVQKWEWDELKNINLKLQTHINNLFRNELEEAYFISEKKKRFEQILNIKNKIFDHVNEQQDDFNEDQIDFLIKNIERDIVRSRILSGKLRIDGRKNNVIRDIDIKLGILKRTHGSALFTRGETQSLSVVTLGTERDAQNIDELIGDRLDRFLFHYNFPPYCVGEIGIISSPKRREIGHGKLAKRSLLAVMPEANTFPYTVRVVSEITESNGSSSMASVCGASLALMNAGVPIKNSIAGIAMGLIKEKDKFVVLSDILGDEDFLGDMDFKVAGNTEGITALQMDIKIEEITPKILKIALYQAKDARIHILNIMSKYIQKPKNEISIFAPRIYKININPEKIKNVIGKGGSVIRMLTEKTKSAIEIEDDGTIKVISANIENAKKALKEIKNITDEIKIHKIYVAKITKIMNFGAFASLNNGKEGLIHVSQISHNKIDDISKHLKLGQQVSVKVIEVDRYGKIRLTMKNINVKT
ncbi:MAG: polyribonucleotide nucleotidyltransferase [Wigglesworthia glossinidia]|nr:polyribonucleotide nucleotidyltransferase [Wigglesworthia glossinidia]